MAKKLVIGTGNEPPVQSFNKKDDRKGDRHKKRTGDRHKPRTGDRHKKKEKSNLDISFIAIDGEGWDGKYTLFKISSEKYDRREIDHGLSTLNVLRYLRNTFKTGKDAVVGFGLGYDFENILKDLPQEDYLRLLRNDNNEMKENPVIVKDPDYLIEYKLRYIPRKFLEVIYTRNSYEKERLKEQERKLNCEAQGKEYKEKEYTGTIYLQDVFGFFQSSFEVALKKWNIEAPDIIKKGKAMRNMFQAKNIDFIAEYNQEELILLIDLMEKLKAADKKAFEDIGLKPNHNSRIWYGPGSRASNFLTQTKFVDSNPRSFNCRANDILIDKIKELFGFKLIENRWNIEHYKMGIKVFKNKLKEAPGDYVAEQFINQFKDMIKKINRVNKALKKEPGTLKDEEKKLLKEYEKYLKELQKWEVLKEYPFSVAYYGGRIEAAAKGVFKETLYDYDINSAYPYAISNIPEWGTDSLVYVEGFDKLNRIGMYFVKWDVPESNFYPFPFRTKEGSVFYPSSGSGFYMSPEVNSALEVYGPEHIKVEYGFVLIDTDSYGAMTKNLPQNKICMTAKKMREIAAKRLEAKSNKEEHEKALKLIMNSVYGKTIQQIGSHKFLNLFAAALITSTCRAFIFRAIGRDTENKIISIMTDGVISRKELNVTLGKQLGQFDREEFHELIQFMPGVYRLKNYKTGEVTKRYRGMDKEFDHDKAKKYLYGRKKYTAKVNRFITRILAIRQPEEYGPYALKFKEVDLEQDFGLYSKRLGGPTNFRLKKGEKNSFFPAIFRKPGHHLEYSYPFILKFDQEELIELMQEEGNKWDQEELFDSVEYGIY